MESKKGVLKVKLFKFTISAAMVLIVSAATFAECSLDHLIIGRNRDGIPDTEDDWKLFVDCGQKYRHSGSGDYENWYYPLHESIFSSYRYRLGEPGFDIYQTSGSTTGYAYDPNRALVGEPNVDYSIIVECLYMSPGLRLVHKEYPQFTIDEEGQYFSHSDIHQLRDNPHMHLSYQATDDYNLHWITYFVYDAFADGNEPNHYSPADPVTIVFTQEPLAGDLMVDGTVDMNDLVELCYYWLESEGDRSNDYYERADANRDGAVDFLDFALMASNWHKSLEDE